MPSIVGIGLVALDVVIDEQSGEQIGEWAGGSCGNVMAILAYLGWMATPISRLDDGEPSRRIRVDLGRWGIDEQWLALEPTAPAAIYVERLGYDKSGVAHHRFERFCPECGQRLPQYRAVTREALRPILAEIVTRDVLFIDRPSPGAVLAAEHASEHGMFVYFEPSARGDQRHLVRIAACSDVVKYSADRLTDSDRRAIAATTPSLEIETRGADGLRFRSHGMSWSELPAPSVDIKDTAGAGDWMTAGLLHALLNSTPGDPARGLRSATKLLATAQAMGAFSCGFVGARGAMEHQSADDVLAGAAALRIGDRHGARRRRTANNAAASSFNCGACA